MYKVLAWVVSIVVVVVAALWVAGVDGTSLIK